MAMTIFFVVNGMGIVFLLYVLGNFWKEGRRPKSAGARQYAIPLSHQNRQDVIVVTHRISGGLQVEPAPVSGGLHASLDAFSVKVEPAPVSHSAQAGLSVVPMQMRDSSVDGEQSHRESIDGAGKAPMKRFSTR